MQAAGDRLQREQRARAWLAWHTEALARTKRLPDFDKFAGGAPRPERQSQEDLNMHLRMLAAAWSGGKAA